MSSRAERGISDRKQSEAAAPDGPLRATTAGRARRRPAVHSTVAVVATRRLHLYLSRSQPVRQTRPSLEHQLVAQLSVNAPALSTSPCSPNSCQLLTSIRK